MVALTYPLPSAITLFRLNRVYPMRSCGPAPPYGRKPAGAALTELNALARITKRRSDLVVALNETLRGAGFTEAIRRHPTALAS